MREILKAKKNVATTTYEYVNGFMVDIVRDYTEKMAYAYLYHEKYGVKELMFGAEIGTERTPEYEDFVEMVANNLIYANYIEGYKSEYFD